LYGIWPFRFFGRCEKFGLLRSFELFRAKFGRGICEDGLFRSNFNVVAVWIERPIF